MTTKQQILKLLREDLDLAKRRERVSSIEMSEDYNYMNITHHYTDLGVVNGILNSIDTVLGVKE